MIDQLYENVGGSATIKKLVGIFYDRVLADPMLAPFFPNADMSGLRAKQVMFLTMLLGRERTFTGRDLSTAHAGARIQGLTDAHFDALLRHFDESMQELDIAAEYIQQVLARIEATRDAVLGRTAGS